MSLGQIIRERRESLKLTLDEVAAKTGFSKPYISTVETGKVKNPPSDNLLSRLEGILKFERGQLCRLAHIERMPDELRHDFETIDAQNKRFRRIIRKFLESGLSTEGLEGVISPEELDFQEGKTDLTVGRLVPVINKVSAGYPAEFDDLGYPVGFADDYIRCPDVNDANAFAVRVVGDSMEPRYREGDVVIFSPNAQVHNGDDCFVRFSEPHEATFKRVFFEEMQGRRQVRLQPRNDKYPPLMVEGDRINGMYRAVFKVERL